MFGFMVKNWNPIIWFYGKELEPDYNTLQEEIKEYIKNK
jgi:hypothetical protein